MAQKPSIPKGTRDFGQIEMAQRNYIFDTIRSVFRSYGYSQIETPAMENLSTLLGKYGEEGDKLLFRILNSGDAFAKADPSKPLTPQVCEKGLRYDLTVPFARFVVQHQNELSFPFKRFQIQPVWRADRPQKGRYREFYQCDVDAIGSRSQLCELELVQIVDAVFRKLDVNVLIKINNRKVLTGLAEVCGFPDKVVDITVAIDKLDKIGLDAVKEEMLSKGLTEQAVAVLEPVLLLSGTTAEKLAKMREIMSTSPTGLLGLDELHMYDLYTPLVKEADVKIPFEQAKQTVYEALAPLGEDYRAVIKEGFENRWIDVYENEGKCSGAYSAGANVHPYVLLNHTDDLQSAFTLAHEMGHALHSYYSNENLCIFN